MYQIESIAQIIEDAGLGTLGTDLFLYHSPSDTPNCIILHPSNDPPLIDPDLPNYFRGKFQLIIRNYDRQAGIDQSATLAQALTKNEFNTPDIYIKYMRPLMQVRVYRRSPGGEVEFNVTYEIVFIAK